MTQWEIQGIQMAKAPQTFFIFGMRRSGTTMLMRIVQKLPIVKSLLFEPHELWFATKQASSKRYKDSAFAAETLGFFRRLSGTKGAKFAVNPGVDWFSWRQLDRTFNPAFIFIKRNRQDVYQSYMKVDAKRGFVPEEIHKWFFDYFYADWESFVLENHERAIMLNYDDIVLRKEGSLKLLFDMFGCSLPKATLDGLIRKPSNTRGLAA